MAYAESLEGPWTPYRPRYPKKHPLHDETVELDDGGVLGFSHPGVRSICDDHIASPQVVDRERLGNPAYAMYFHCPSDGGSVQRTYVATSQDGLAWDVDASAPEQYVSRAYASVVRWEDGSDGRWLASSRTTANRVALSRGTGDGLSATVGGDSGWNQVGCQGRVCDQAGFVQLDGSDLKIHHAAMFTVGSDLFLAYHVAGEPAHAPMSIGFGRLQTDLLPRHTSEWREVSIEAPFVLLQPELAWEMGDGLGDCDEPGQRGPLRRPHCDVRDPSHFSNSGRDFIVYAAAGEKALGVAALSTTP
jgi:hypothetical protein